MAVLVTGGAGFLGSHLCEALLARRREVLCVDNFFTGRKANVAHLAGNRIVEMVKEDLKPSQILTREAFENAIKVNAAALILVHNHPSGDPTPSPDDIAVDCVCYTGTHDNDTTVGWFSSGSGNWDVKSSLDGTFRLDLEEPERLRLLVRAAGLAPTLSMPLDYDPAVGMLDVEDDHLGRTAGLAAALDHAGERIETLHEAHRTRRHASPVQGLQGPTQVREVGPGPGAVLEEHALGLGQVQDGLHGIGDRVDEAGRALWPGLHAHVEPDRAVEGHLLVQQQVSQLSLKRGQVLIRGEVPLRGGPAGDGVDDTVDELPQ